MSSIPSKWKISHPHFDVTRPAAVITVIPRSALAVAMTTVSGDSLDERCFQYDVELHQGVEDVHQELGVVGVPEERRRVVHVRCGRTQREDLKPVM